MLYKNMQTSYSCSALQLQVLILSVIDGLGALILLGLLTYTFFPELEEISDGDIDSDFILTFIFSVSALLIQFVLAGVLFHGARHDRRRPCRIWICVSTLLFILKMIIVIVHFATKTQSMISYGLLIDSAYKLYQGVIVGAFLIREVNDDGEGSGTVVLHKKRSVRQLHV